MEKNSDGEELVGHIPYQLSEVLTHFIGASQNNQLNAVVIAKRKREMGLVVPAKFVAITENKRFAETLREKIESKKNELELTVEQGCIVKMPFN